MLVYDRYFTSRAALYISWVAIGVAIVYYLFSLIGDFLPVILTKSALPQTASIWSGIVCGVAMVAALSATKLLGRSKYAHLFGILQLFSIFFTMEWIGYVFVCILTGAAIYTALALFIPGCLFFIMLINYYSGKQWDFKKPVIYLAFSFTFLYPLIQIVGFTGGAAEGSAGGLTFAAIFLHYIALTLLVILAMMTLSRIYRRNSKHSLEQRGIQIVAIAFLFFLFCSEYTNLTFYISGALTGSSAGSSTGADPSASNQYLPYSIIMTLITLSIFIWAIIKHNPFLRNTSIILFVAILLKLFAYDFATLSPGARSALFIFLGLLLIASALTLSPPPQKDSLRDAY